MVYSAKASVKDHLKDSLFGNRIRNAKRGDFFFKKKSYNLPNASRSMHQ